MAAPSICGKIEAGNLPRNGGPIPPFPDAPAVGAAASSWPQQNESAGNLPRNGGPIPPFPDVPRGGCGRVELAAAKRKRGEPSPKRRFHPAVPGCPPRCVRPRRI